MKKALVQGTRICEFGTPFPVHEDLKWVDVADDTTTQDTYVDGSVVKYVVPTLSYAENVKANTLHLRNNSTRFIITE